MHLPWIGKIWGDFQTVVSFSQGNNSQTIVSFSFVSKDQCSKCSGQAWSEPQTRACSSPVGRAQGYSVKQTLPVGTSMCGQQWGSGGQGAQSLPSVCSPLPFVFQSVILPVHDAEPWLDECLRSVLQQDFQGSMELSVFNDASKVLTNFLLVPEP